MNHAKGVEFVLEETMYYGDLDPHIKHIIESKRLGKPMKQQTISLDVKMKANMSNVLPATHGYIAYCSVDFTHLPVEDEKVESWLMRIPKEEAIAFILTSSLEAKNYKMGSIFALVNLAIKFVNSQWEGAKLPALAKLENDSIAAVIDRFNEAWRECAPKDDSHEEDYADCDCLYCQWKPPLVNPYDFTMLLYNLYTNERSSTYIWNQFFARNISPFIPKSSLVIFWLDHFNTDKSETYESYQNSHPEIGKFSRYR